MHLNEEKVRQLIDLMNSMSSSAIPPQQPIIEMFDLAMNDQMLDYLIAIGNQPHTIEELKNVYVSMYGDDENEWKKHLDELLLMSFIHPKNNEERHLYELSPIFPGWVEFYTSGPSNEKRRAILSKFMEFWVVLKQMNRPSIRRMNDRSTLNELKKGIPPRISVTLSNGNKEIQLNQPLQSRQEVYTAGDVYKILEKNKDEIAIGNCFCRSYKIFNQHEQCEHDIPLQSCIALGALADQLVNNGVGRKISFEEAVTLLKEFESKGCIHTAYHFRNDVTYDEIIICNCCKDCCLLYKGYIEGGLSKIYARAFYKPEIIDIKRCVGCNLCGKYCPTEATYYDHESKQLIFNYENCIGCGQCVNQCKFNVRKMIKDERDVFVKTKEI